MAFHISSLLKCIPTDLDVCQAEAAEDEIREFTDIRKRYAADPSKAKAEADKIRAFRLLRGLRRYIEIGTFDKFNLRYVMSLLDRESMVIDLDIAENHAAQKRLESEKPESQTYHCLIGDSSSRNTLAAVRSTAGEAPFDAVFIDANHVAAYAMTDFALYGELVSKTGYVFFHDVKWEGGPNNKGVADALDVLQRFVPVYQVLIGEPVTHWYRPLVRNPNSWGGIGIIRGVDFHEAVK